MEIKVYYTEEFEEAPGGIETCIFTAEGEPSYRVAFGKDSQQLGLWGLQVSRWNDYHVGNAYEWEIKELLLNHPADTKVEYMNWLVNNVYEVEIDGATFWQNPSFKRDWEYGCWEPRCTEEVLPPLVELGGDQSKPDGSSSEDSSSFKDLDEMNLAELAKLAADLVVSVEAILAERDKAPCEEDSPTDTPPSSDA